MLPEDVSISWTKEAGTDVSEAFISANDAPVIYKRGNEGSRCTINLRISRASQAIVVSNAKSCEFYELDALGRQDYQGYCQGVSRGPGRWQLTLAGKVSIAHHVFLHQQYQQAHMSVILQLTGCIQLLRKTEKLLPERQCYVQGRNQSFKLVLCGLSPADQLKLWDISIMEIVPLMAPRPHHTEDATPLTSGASKQAQMEGIRQILRQGTESAGTRAEADPKRRLMHALANAALERNDKVGIHMLSPSVCWNKCASSANGRPVAHASDFCACGIGQKG